MNGLSPRAALLQAAALLALILFAAPSQAAVVALFADTAFVDYNPGNSGSEASNLQATLVSQGDTVNTFTGTTASDWSTALTGVNVLVIPEQENGALYPALAAGAVTAIQNFVTNGGTLIVGQDYENFLNSMFGWSLATGGNDPYSLTANAAGTSFAGGPATLPYNNDTTGFTGLPTSATCMYDNTGTCAVFTATYGSGSIIYLGWDWFDAAPTGTQDGGWLSVLNSAVTFNPTAANVQPIPTLGYPALLLLTLALIGFVARKRRSLFA